jgi:hypothetical protein
MVVIIVMILLFFGFVGYSLFQGQQLEDNQRQFQALNAIDIAQRAASMHDLACTHAPETDAACVDAYRLHVLNETDYAVNSDAYNYYRTQFGAATITVTETYPQPRTWTIYNNTASNRTKIPIRVPVQINNPLKPNTYSFGIMHVVIYR